MTDLLRILLGLLVLLLAAAALVLHAISLEEAQAWPELAHLRVPVYLATVVGAVPVLLAIAVAFDLLRVVDDGRTRSDHVLRPLRLLAALSAAFAAYLLVWLVVVSTLIGTHPGIVLAWVGAEVLALTFARLLALLHREVAAVVDRDDLAGSRRRAALRH